MTGSEQLDIVDYNKDEPKVLAILDHFGLMAALRGFTKGELTEILIKRKYATVYIEYAYCVRDHFSHNGITLEEYDTIRADIWSQFIKDVGARSRQN